MLALCDDKEPNVAKATRFSFNNTLYKTIGEFLMQIHVI